MRFSTDAKLGAVLTLFCMVMLAATFWIEERSYATLGAAIFPRIVLALLTPLCVAVLVRGLRNPGAGAPEASTGRVRPREWIGKNRNILATYLLFFLLVFAMPYLGFYLTGTGFVLLMFMVMGPKGWKHLPGMAVVAVLTTSSIYLVFRYLLNVLVPEFALF